MISADVLGFLVDLKRIDIIHTHFKIISRQGLKVKGQGQVNLREGLVVGGLISC